MNSSYVFFGILNVYMFIGGVISALSWNLWTTPNHWRITAFLLFPQYAHQLFPRLIKQSMVDYPTSRSRYWSFSKKQFLLPDTWSPSTPGCLIMYFVGRETQVYKPIYIFLITVFWPVKCVLELFKIITFCITTPICMLVDALESRKDSSPFS